ncbi:MAG: bifunctional UDP-N-acetylglucosamine diphosphorylase/glucosamine-1-phosphate N-acetyltransferase GlmU [Anaerolineae bacterium]|nr:bifunctional UDP-N-acetylglucosamine diphosphorylase/glucosamine-1-phosphate N-acetyltransferase GlmU [Candidatus Roseilinea sp.]MDW8450775.1 bifunctional UDP-N-acetylglucosamine diphosphorylase/glucosamine-1-phosphate N-acetyltransferase GlmU [Anaerolineae bacterium]
MSDEPDHPHANTRAVVLAAGMGTRMKSKRPKILHSLAGRPLIDHCITIATRATGTTPVVVIGHGAEPVRAAVGERAIFALQAEQLGTGHAVMHAEACAAGATQIVVTYGDMPLLRPETLRRLMDLRERSGAAIAMLTLISDNPRGFGRVIRDAQGERVLAVVEEVSCTPAQLAIRELNVGAYCFDGAWVWDALKRIRPNPQKGEYFLTDLIEIAVADGREVRALTTDDRDECIGINTRVDLADAERALRRRITRQHMLNGVTIADPETTYIEEGVEIGADTVILPNTHLVGRTRIGSDCQIGPNSYIVESQIGDRVQIVQSMIEHSRVEDDVHIGPFSHLRPGAHVGAGAHVGNFAEIKNSTLGAGSHMGHFSYLGDATVGEHVNIGAGTITCNFDGVKKNRTVIGDHAFIGSDTMLVAPVTVGERARTGAGAVVTKDVPDATLAVGVPARVIRKLGDPKA